MTRRRMLVLAAAVVGLAGVTATGGISSIAVERGVEVQIADDRNAYLGFEQNATNVGNGSADLEVRASNQLGTTTAFTTVEVTVDGTTADLTGDGALEPGDVVTRTFRSVSCEERVAVSASGDGVSVRFDRPVECEYSRN